MTLFSVDISNNNGANLSLAQIKSEGYAFVQAKVSEGDYFQDLTWQGYKRQAQAAGIPIVGYHYANAGSNPTAQAQTYIGNGGGNTVMIDFEANSGTIGDYWNLVNAFNAAGVEVVLSYIPHWYWSGAMGGGDLSKVPGLISSSYFGSGDFASSLYSGAGGDSGAGWASYGGGNVVLWQFTDGASAAGYSLDANAFKGTQSDLLTLLGAAPAVNAIDAYATSNAWLGARITKGENATPDNVGRFAQFANGYVYWAPDTGAHGIPNALFTKWAATGWEAGTLGYPVLEATTLPAGVCQAFQGGLVYQQTGKNPFFVHGALGARWSKDGYEKSPEGWPTSDEYAHNSGRGQDFENGSLYWDSSNVVFLQKAA